MDGIQVLHVEIKSSRLTPPASHPRQCFPILFPYSCSLSIPPFQFSPAPSPGLFASSCIAGAVFVFSLSCSLQVPGQSIHCLLCVCWAWNQCSSIPQVFSLPRTLIFRGNVLSGFCPVVSSAVCVEWKEKVLWEVHFAG